MPKIYESPDKGDTIYEREIGEPQRLLVEENLTNYEQILEDKMWGDIRRLARTNPALQDALERVIVVYNLIKVDEW